MKIGEQERRVVLSAALVAVAVVGIIIWGFWRQIDRLVELRAAEEELLPLVTYEKQQNELLHQELKHVTSPGYTEEWARVHGVMTRSDEVLVMVEGADDVEEPSASSPQATTPSFWESVLRFFGQD